MTHVVVSGANRGIGLEFCRQYVSQGATVTALCRQASPELEALDINIVEGIDVAQAIPADLIELALGDAKVDILINNAGILRFEDLSQLDMNTIEAQLQANTLGPLRVTEALLPYMESGSKIAMITSRMGSIEDNSSGGYYGYRMSKAALNCLGKSLAIDLAHQGISVALLHPGFVQTEMVNGAGDISAETAAERLMARINELSIEVTGSFWHSNGENLPW